MAQTATHLIDHVIPRVPVRHWVLSFPIPLLYLFAARPHLLTPVLQVIHRTISTFLVKQAGLKRIEAQIGAITLIQRFGSAVNLNIYRHSYCRTLCWRYSTITAEVDGVALNNHTRRNIKPLVSSRMSSKLSCAMPFVTIPSNLKYAGPYFAFFIVGSYIFLCPGP